MQVTKRDGRKVEFNKEKIRIAIKAAAREANVGEEINPVIEKICNEIEGSFKDGDTIESIQSLVEKKLMGSKFKEVATKYIEYRHDRDIAREKNSYNFKIIKEKLSASNVQNQNANVDEHSFGGKKGEAANEILKKYALDFCMSEKSKNNHLNNEVYIHDLDSYALGMHNCLSIPFDDLLAKGFNTRQTDVRPANSINTAFQLVAVIFQLQSLQQFGGCSATHLDWTMVPYVRKSFYKHFKDGCKYVGGEEVKLDFDPDMSITSEYYAIGNSGAYQYAIDMTKRELNQAVEGMYHNLK